MSKDIPSILMKNVNYTYPSGTDALKDINLKISKGELIGIMGMNGAGKTTLIRTLNGLIRPNKGDIYLNGDNIKSKNIGKLSQSVGIIFQNPYHQVFSQSVEEEIKFSLKSLNLDKNEVQNITDNILKKFNFEKYREHSPLNLSGGETKKLALASIFCRDPEILIFDEPTLGQDALEIQFFRELIFNEINRGKTIIIVTHNIEFAIENISRTILMAEGSIIADGPTNKILTNEFLINQCSLILPQISQLIKALESIGINIPKDIYLKEDMVNALNNYLNDKKIKNKGASS